MKDLYVYILTNERRTTLYIGVTNNLEGRLWQHQNDEGSQFARRYNLTLLVYYETYPDPTSAIARETQLKGWSRAKKDALISKLNPAWENLAPMLFGDDSLVVRRDSSTTCPAPLPPGHSAQNDRGEGVNDGEMEEDEPKEGFR